MDTRWRVLRSLAAHPAVLAAGPRLDLFLLGYMRKFRVREVGGDLILHSHLPPLNSPAYGRFIDEHLARWNEGPSHAQIAITSACPQHCDFCYNRERAGTPLRTPDILRAIDTLADMGVFWLGLTGGEPLLNPDIVEIVERAARRCAVKLFTTGCTLTPPLAARLKRAGLFSVCVSLDHWREELHDRGRNYPGAFRAALAAIRDFRDAGLDTGVSAVLSREMIASGACRELLAFFEGLGVHEAWLSEVKPSAPAFWEERTIAGDAERRTLRELQDRHNRARPPSGMTVNYLGHFESEEHFGCNAGHKMIYIDAFGEVSPCVFTPITFGNIRDRDLPGIWSEMTASFRPSSTCFIHENWRRIRSCAEGAGRLSAAQTRLLMRDARFGSLPRFYQLYYRRHGRGDGRPGRPA
jgi:MoaA/NifB/PqqE/SkfB family radical SAM enzyme